MNILVCVKQIVDCGAPIEIDAAANDLRDDEVAWAPNPADLVAVSIACAIRDRLESGAVIALSAGPERVAAVLRKSLMLGADRAARLAWTGGGIAEPGVAAVLLAAAAIHFDASLVLCGGQAEDSLSGLTGFALSAALDWPVVPFVERLVGVEDGRTLILRSRTEGGYRQIVRIDAPAVLTCEAGASELAYSSLPRVMAGQSAPIAVLTPADVGVSAAVLSHRKRLEVTGLTYPRPRPKRIFTPDSGQPAGERIKQIMSAGLARRRSRILEGPPREIAAELVKLLRRHKII